MNGDKIMKLLFLRQTALDMLQREIHQNLTYYDRPEPWLDEFFQAKGICNYYFDSGIEIPDFQLVIGNSDTDTENAKRIYESFRGALNRLQATDFRLWAYMTHIICWDYMKARWKLERGGNYTLEGRITDRYLIASRSRYMRNGISRLYWCAELTYDENNSNPYEYLEYVLKYQDLAVGALDRQIGRAKNSILGNLKALKEAELNEDDRRLFFTKINQYGGVTLLDAISKEKSYDISRGYIDSILRLPLVENGKSIVVRNMDNGMIMNYNVINGKLVSGNARVNTTDRLLRRRKGSIIDINKSQWQIVEIR